MRSLEVRLAEYAKATHDMVPQLNRILSFTPDEAITVSSHAPLNDAIRLYDAIAGDLDKIIAGEELRPWRIEVEF